MGLTFYLLTDACRVLFAITVDMYALIPRVRCEVIHKISTSEWLMMARLLLSACAGVRDLLEHESGNKSLMQSSGNECLLNERKNGEDVIAQAVERLNITLSCSLGSGVTLSVRGSTGVNCGVAMGVTFFGGEALGVRSSAPTMEATVAST